MTLPGRGELKGTATTSIGARVSPNYLQLLRIPLLKGRYLSADDRAGAPPVIVINEAAAQTLLAGTGSRSASASR